MGRLARAAQTFYKERLGTGSPPHPPQCAHWGTYGLWWLRLDLTEQSPGLFDPRGEGFGRGSFPAEHPILPPNRLTRQGTPRRVSPPAGGERKSNHVLTGSAGQNILLAPRVPALLARVGVHPPILGAQRSGSQNSRPPWCSFLRLSSKESRAPRRSRRGPRGAAPQGGFGATYPKGTYPPFPGEEPLISPGAAAGYPPPKIPGRGTPPGAGRPPGPSTAGGCPRGLSWRRSPCASRR